MSNQSTVSVKDQRTCRYKSTIRAAEVEGYVPIRTAIRHVLGAQCALLSQWFCEEGQAGRGCRLVVIRLILMAMVAVCRSGRVSSRLVVRRQLVRRPIFFSMTHWRANRRRDRLYFTIAIHFSLTARCVRTRLL